MSNISIFTTTDGIRLTSGECRMLSNVFSDHPPRHYTSCREAYSLAEYGLLQRHRDDRYDHDADLSGTGLYAVSLTEAGGREAVRLHEQVGTWTAHPEFNPHGHAATRVVTVTPAGGDPLVAMSCHTRLAPIGAAESTIWLSLPESIEASVRVDVHVPGHGEWSAYMWCSPEVPGGLSHRLVDEQMLRDFRAGSGLHHLAKRWESARA